MSIDFRRQAVLLHFVADVVQHCCCFDGEHFPLVKESCIVLFFQGHGVHEPSLMCLLGFNFLYLPSLVCLSSTVFDNFPFKGYTCVLKLFFIPSTGRFYEWRCSHFLCRLHFLLHNLFWKSSLDFFLDSCVKKLSSRLSWPLVYSVFVCYFLVTSHRNTGAVGVSVVEIFPFMYNNWCQKFLIFIVFHWRKFDPGFY